MEVSLASQPSDCPVQRWRWRGQMQQGTAGPGTRNTYAKHGPYALTHLTHLVLIASLYMLR